MKKNRTIVAGRKPTLETDSQLTERVCALLAEGVSIQTACNLCDISERAYHDWLRRGRAGEEPYAAFFDAASRARDSWKARLIRRVDLCADRGDWRAAAFLLERQFPAEFGSKGEEVQAPGKPLAPPVIKVTIHRDEASDRARERFGEPPPGRRRYKILNDAEAPSKAGPS